MDNLELMLPEASRAPMLPNLFMYNDGGRQPQTDRKLRAVLREWPTFVSCFLGIVALGGVYLVTAPRHYSASAVVMAAPRQQDLSRTDSVLNATLTPEPALHEPDIEGEIEIMSAPAAIQHVVKDLDLDNVSNAELSSHASIYDLMQDVRVLTGLEHADATHPVTMKSFSDQILARIGLGGTENAAPIAVSRRTELEVELVSRNLKVAPIGRSKMVKIDFTASSPALAARVATAVAENYIRTRNQNRVDAANQAGDWLRSHTDELRNELVSSESDLAKFRSAAQTAGRDPIQLESDMKVLGDRIIAAKAEQTKATMRLAVAEERVRRDGPLSLLSWDATPGADETLAQSRAVAETHREAAKMALTAGSFNPNVARLEAEAKVLDAKLTTEAQTRLGNIRMTADAASREVASLEVALQKMRSNYDQLDAASIQLSALQQATVAARAVYQNFVTRLKTTEQTGFNEAQGWLVSAASIPVRPSWPSIPLVLIGSVVAGLGVGLSGALWKEYLGSRTLRSSEDIERLLPGARSLGLLPEIAFNCSSSREVVAATGTGSDPEFDEAVGNVWTSIDQAIQQTRSTTRGRIVLISSALPREGKSAATGIIACAAAAAGKRVVVVDCDLRLPTMHHALAVAASPGLVDYVEGNMIYHSVLGVNPVKRVSVLPAGRALAAPQQLLRSSRLAGLLSNLRNDFDLVLIDSPPVLGLSDARLLSKLADDTILVATWSRTTWKAVALALNLITRNGGHIAGVVLTRTNMERVAKFGSAEAEQFRGEYSNYYRGYYNAQANRVAIQGPVG